MTADRLRRIWADRTDDRGTSLMELVVAMALFAVFLAIFTTAFVVVSRTVNKVGAVTNTSQQVTQAFQTLDRKVRYAAAITAPGRATSSGATGDWYVEYDTTNTGTEVCTQLRVDSGNLQSRTWTVAGTGYTNLTSWNVLASGLSNGAGSSTSPFTTGVSAASSAFQQLTVTVTATSSAGTSATSTATMTFTAVNSSSGRDTSSFCTQVSRP